MKRSIYGLIVAPVLLWSLSAQAQSEKPEGKSEEQALIEQLGAQPAATESIALPVANRTTLVQVGASNEALLRQSGVNNVINASQSGALNQYEIIQNGVANSVNSLIVGSNTSSAIRQEGDYNKVEQELRVDGRQYTVQQLGSNNELTQRETGSAAPAGYDIKMQGNGIRLTIEQGVKTFQP
ncbi:hypothetical protein [Hymenobacter sp. DG01]|uniref:hypothetical protein n=1 Tax=Hymenobacter sp. DG01 TaxID=2584940 RepID=UPI0011233EF2|nr:hypothetical protein [Hymenobacter sp. DG01]